MPSKQPFQTIGQNLVELPTVPIKIGIFISGGLDSALLYHLLQQANKKGLHQLVPITVIKNSYTLNTVKSILSFFSCREEPLILNGPISQAVPECYNLGFNRVYVGTIKELPEFLIGWSSSTYPETKFFKTPFKNLDKSEIVQLILHHDLTKLFEITHSCASLDIGRCNTCNRCRERKWAFEQLDLVDPGVL